MARSLILRSAQPLALLLVVVVLAATSLPVVCADSCAAVTANDRVDCWPEDYQDMNQATCVRRGCCWDTSPVAAEAYLARRAGKPLPPRESTPLRGEPICFYPQTFGYTMTNRQSLPDGFTATLVQRKDSPAPYGNDVSQLTLTVQQLSDSIVHFKMVDAHNARYEVPIKMPATPLTPPSNNPLNSISTYSNPFSLAITRRSTGQAVFNSTAYGGLTFSDQFLQLSTRLASSNVYGLGEHVAPFLLQTEQYPILSLFSRDQGTPQGYTNLYGVHPLLLTIEPNGAASGIFMLNSNAIDAVLQPTPGLTLRTIGGVLDFYVFLGPTVDNVVQQYTAVVGRPYFPPYWSLGFHLCRWGYNSANNTLAVVEAMRQNNIPQDTQWNDIDYMNNHLDYTLGDDFANLPDVVANLHANGQRYVMIVDPAISNTQTAGTYPPFDEGTQQDVFIRAADHSVLVGEVWPGATVFPDFFHPKAPGWWQDQIAAFYEKVGFDGLWIDMNEPSNFVQGSSQGCPSTSLDNPPYVPHVSDSQLLSKTLCMSARHYGNNTHYNLHSLYGYSESVATLNALHAVRKKRTLVVSRSTFAGSGVYAAHWLGDNNPTWDDLRLSIAGILNFNLFGIPFVGADICGFGGSSSNAELCARWMQLGAFYPFSRNHNSINKPAQDPTAFGQQVIDVSRAALNLRYTLLPYLYTLLFQANSQGLPVARALFFDFPTDSRTYAIDTQFLWGQALLITPVVTQGSVSVTGYFPAATWYDVQTGAQLISTGEYFTLAAPLSKINVHVRSGFILPTQQPALTTAAAQQLPFGLIVALDTVAGVAQGSQFVDDGETLQTIDSQTYLFATYNVTCSRDGMSGQLSSTIFSNGFTVKQPLATVTVFGVEGQPSSVYANQAPTKFSYDSQNLVLYITGMTLSLNQPITISWS